MILEVFEYLVTFQAFNLTASDMVKALLEINQIWDEICNKYINLFRASNRFLEQILHQRSKFQDKHHSEKLLETIKAEHANGSAINNDIITCQDNIEAQQYEFKAKKIANRAKNLVTSGRTCGAAGLISVATFSAGATVGIAGSLTPVVVGGALILIGISELILLLKKKKMLKLVVLLKKLNDKMDTLRQESDTFSVLIRSTIESVKKLRKLTYANIRYSSDPDEVIPDEKFRKNTIEQTVMAIKAFDKIKEAALSKEPELRKLILKSNSRVLIEDYWDIVSIFHFYK